MRRLCRTVLIAGFAALGVVPLVSASAQAAAPEWFQKGAPLSHSVAFSSSGGKSLLRFNTATLECGAEKSSGSVEPPNRERNVVITLTGCRGKLTAQQECSVHSKGASSGEIITFPLAGWLGAVAAGQAASEVGVLLEEESGKREFARLEGSCFSPSPVTLTGSVAGEVKPVRTELASSALAFALSGTKQGIRGIIVNGVAMSPKMALGLYEATYEGAANLTFAEALEVT